MVDAFVKMVGVGMEELTKVSKQIGIQCEPKAEGGAPPDCVVFPCGDKPRSILKPSSPWETWASGMGPPKAPGKVSQNIWKVKCFG